MSRTQTKDRILNAAERLFAQQGLDGTSLRTITEAAGVNLAAVNYHFGSKDGLIQAAFRRRARPLNQERLRRLDVYLATLPPDARPELEPVLAAFLAPPFELFSGPGEDATLFQRLIGRLYTDPAEPMRRIFLEEFMEVKRRYGEVLARALPGSSPTELLWALHFTVGTMAHALLASGELRDYTQGQCDPSDRAGLVRRLVCYAAAGIRGIAAASTPRT